MVTNTRAYDKTVESILKVPPHSDEAEQAVIGAIFIDAQAWDKVGDVLREEDFYRSDHQIIYNAITNICEQGKPYDLVTVSEWLESHQLLEQAGGLAALAKIAEDTPSASNIMAYADIVRKRSILRQLIEVTNNINETIYHPQGQSSEQILEQAEESIFEIAEQNSKRMSNKYQPMSHYANDAFNTINALAKQKSTITGLATGFKDLDEKTAGLQPSDLIIIAGRPSMGKTALAINIAEYASIHDKKNIAIFSMEMSGQQLALRMISSLSHINQHNVRIGNLQNKDWENINSSMMLLKNSNMFIDDSASLTPIELRARCRRLYRQHKIDLVIIDYIQLMQMPNNEENRATELSAISRSLKAMARELSVPVVALSQLNRSAESRVNKRPMMSDLRESGAIEQDADVVLLIYRDEQYNEQSKDKGIAEINIGKQRNGSTGIVKLKFQGQYTRFDNLAPSYYESLESRISE